jgi:hypothetical protein
MGVVAAARENGVAAKIQRGLRASLFFNFNGK